ncbi:hypothetical protein CAEBREN_11912 [Caenorhabditis brenneri]|uniref:BHLH domain-containing protein n=1 Tax=Caenorhabditis brenneri TaxID=135651 RepID=G0M9T1_CAEBE|nr:hypothetical protein CAEBREN_11912 [Caenorhabditis brenneri]
MDSSKINIGAPSRKKIRDAERQEELKEKISMLKNLVVKDLDQKMSQLDILKATHKAALKIKNISASGPYCRGFYDGVENIESLVISYIKSLYMNKTKASQISKIRKFFELKQDKTADISRNQSSSTFAGAGAVDMRQVRRQREQNRRDCHSEGYSLLRQFIDENGLCAYSHSPLHRTQVLDLMIDYISQAANATLPSSPDDLKLYLDGFEHGNTVGKASVTSFFETDSFLMNQSAALRTFLELQRGSSSSPTPITSAPVAPSVQFNPLLIYQLPVLFPDLFALPVHQIPSSTGSVASPSSLADASASSSDRDSDSVPVSEEKENESGIFRPWE